MTNFCKLTNFYKKTNFYKMTNCYKTLQIEPYFMVNINKITHMSEHSDLQNNLFMEKYLTDVSKRHWKIKFRCRALQS